MFHIIVIHTISYMFSKQKDEKSQDISWGKIIFPIPVPYNDPYTNWTKAIPENIEDIVFRFYG